MNDLQRIDQLLAGRNPGPITPEEELRRVRLQIAGMMDLAAKAAEAKMPGFATMLAWLVRKESRLAGL